MPESPTTFLHKLLNDLPEESRWIVMQNLPYMPQTKIYDVLLQLEQDVLKKVLLKKGKDSEEYKFFLQITNIIYQAGEAAYLVERLNNELLEFKEYNEFLYKRNAKLQQEVNRFHTLEELATGEVLEIYITRMRDALKYEKEILNQKKKPTDGA